MTVTRRYGCYPSDRENDGRVHRGSERHPDRLQRLVGPDLAPTDRRKTRKLASSSRFERNLTRSDLCRPRAVGIRRAAGSGCALEARACR